MKVLLVEPGKTARPAEIGEGLHELQKVVGGTIQALYPWPDPVALVCYDEGKLIGLPLNRALEDYDIIAGTFFICGVQGADFVSLNDRQLETYQKKFQRPEIIIDSPYGIMVCRCSEREYAAVQEKVHHRDTHPQKKQDYER